MKQILIIIISLITFSCYGQDNVKGKIIINNKTYTGNSVTINGNKIIVNGKDVTTDAKVININITGNVTKIDCDHCATLTVNGIVGNVSTQSGDVNVKGDVKGSVSTMSGDVDCQNINGSVTTMSGSISHKK